VHVDVTRQIESGEQTLNSASCAEKQSYGKSDTYRNIALDIIRKNISNIFCLARKSRAGKIEKKSPFSMHGADTFAG